MNPVAFGFLNEPTNIQWDGGACRISPLAGYPQLIADLENQPGVHGGWWYPLLEKLGDCPDGPSKPKSFSLSPTHELVLACSDASEELANFLIALFGLLKGRRLQREKWQHFYKTPLDSKLNDFLASDASIVCALDAALGFWRSQKPDSIRRLAFGAIHWHLFAQLYEHQFERFNAQYMALDTCAKLALETQFLGYPAGHPKHSERASKLCDVTGVPKPLWVNPLPVQNTCALAERRNALIHEAMYGGQPIGFAFPTDHPYMEMELTGLVARILLRLIGVQNSYVTTACTTRQTQCFD
jgi:hypothetical protein